VPHPFGISLILHLKFVTVISPSWKSVTLENQIIAHCTLPSFATHHQHSHTIQVELSLDPQNRLSANNTPAIFVMACGVKLINFNSATVAATAHVVHVGACAALA